MSDASRKSYGQVVKSSALIGGSQFLNIGVGIVRTKAMALLLGPEGVGLLGLFWQISECARSIAGMGINSSGVRQIAESAATGDSHRIARTVRTLRRVALVLGGAGALLLAILSPWVSRLSFGDATHTGEIALLGLAVLFGEISAAQGALLQGMRRIADLARSNFLGALYGSALSIVIVWFLRKDGIVLSLVCLAGMGIAISWWYARKVTVLRLSLNLPEVAAEASALLKLGVAFMSSFLASMAAGYFVRIIVVRKIGVEEAGFYQAAWTLGGFYVGFILQAMGADFFPRLSGAAHNNPECNRLVNEQAEVGLLIAGPGLLGTLSVAPLVISVFYTSQFGPAVELLRWICLGMVLRVVSWPMSFIILAKGLRDLYLASELAINILYVGLVWAGVHLFGLNGTGYAFFAMYLVYAAGIYLIVRRTSGFRWSGANRKLGLVFAPLVAGVFLSWYFLPRTPAVILGAAIAVLTGIYSLRTLCTLIPFERLPGPLQRLLTACKLARP